MENIKKFTGCGGGGQIEFELTLPSLASTLFPEFVSPQLGLLDVFSRYSDFNLILFPSNLIHMADFPC